MRVSVSGAGCRCTTQQLNKKRTGGPLLSAASAARNEGECARLGWPRRDAKEE